MNKSQRVLRDLEIVVGHTFEKLMGSVIIKVGDQYVLFNKYSITRLESGISVFRRRDHSTITFDKMKHAVIWIMLDHGNRFHERDKMKQLDGMLASITVDKKIHENLKAKNRGDIELFLLYKTKLDRDRNKEKQIIAEIDKYRCMVMDLYKSNSNIVDQRKR
jgi:hypothetical protein